MDQDRLNQVRSEEAKVFLQQSFFGAQIFECVRSSQYSLVQIRSGQVKSDQDSQVMQTGQDKTSQACKNLETIYFGINHF